MTAPEPYEYRLIDPTNMPSIPDPMPYQGTHVQLLRDALLDVLHVALGTGISPNEVDEALALVLGHWAGASPGRLGRGDPAQ